ncbi:MAG: hypothetical protein ABH824_05360 [Nanoarchaeota archaeon]|nr:hypothetical protein [Nanoarchaeota archaeon]MBU1631905.1 hypothetical protein [Nanoarchaeota archaeon]MBU1876608.1 hypothetical protein [Nanoarchaeota archaeon]
MTEENKKEIKKKSEDNDEEEKLEVFPAEEQGIISEDTSEEKEIKMEHGEIDEDIYTKEGREMQEDDSEIEPWEEGFMEGASQAAQLGKDALTGEPLMDVEDVFETEIGGKVYRFVNEENAQKFREKKRKEEED